MVTISLIQACRLLFELRGKRTSLLAHQTLLHGEHSRLNQCLGLNHYSSSMGTFCDLHAKTGDQQIEASVKSRIKIRAE